MSRFKKIQRGSLAEQVTHDAVAYRDHVKTCTRCMSAEHRLRPRDFRCADGNALYDKCDWFGGVSTAELARTPAPEWYKADR